MKSTSGLISHYNTCKGHFYPKPPHELLRHKFHNEVDVLGENWEDESDLLGKTVTTVIANGTPEMPTEDTPQKKLFTN